MEKDTVLLSVEKYNELRDFKKEAEESLKASKFAVIEERWGNFDYSNGYIRKYYTEGKIVFDFEKRNKSLEERNKSLCNNNVELRRKIENIKAKIGKSVTKEISINDVKKMSYWQFLKWKKS